MVKELGLSIGCNALARWLEVSPASILTWSKELPELFLKAPDGGFMMSDGLATWASLTKPLLKSRNRWQVVKALWRNADLGIATALATNGRAFLIGDRARGRLFVIVLPAGVEPQPIVGTEVVNLSELASRWASEISKECVSRRGRPRKATGSEKFTEGSAVDAPADEVTA